MFVLALPVFLFSVAFFSPCLPRSLAPSLVIDLTTLSGDDTPGNVQRLCAKAMNPVLDETYKRPPVVVDKRLEDFKTVSSEALGEVKNLGFGPKTVGKEHVYGMPSQAGAPARARTPLLAMAPLARTAHRPAARAASLAAHRRARTRIPGQWARAVTRRRP